MILQLAGVALIAWSAIDDRKEPLAPLASKLLMLAIAAIAIVALQLFPLPARLWTHLGPRHALARDFALLGMPIPREPLSLTPTSTLSSLFCMIPPLAVFCTMVRLRAFRNNWVAAALIAGTLAGITLGTIQVATSTTELSSWYLYEDTSGGKAVGFFANADHMATLLLMTIPFLAALVSAANEATIQRYSAVVAISAGVAVVIVVGLALNGSLAGYGLALPVIAASVLIVVRVNTRRRMFLLALATLAVMAGVTAIENTAIGSAKIGEEANASVQSRAEVLSTSLRAAADFLPLGSGLGSFASVYPLYESPERVTNVYVVHAHNEYVEVGLELGLPGVALMVLFLVWWGVAVWRAWRTAEARPFPRAAAVASATVLVHSLVDFPLRTAAIAACFAMCLGLLADGRAAEPQERAVLRRTRHVEIR
jgi:O-antigen ligase